MNYGKRLQQALDRAQKDRNALAAELKISVQAVGQVITGGRSGTQTFNAENSTRAARFLHVEPEWLATGEGPMVSERIWPFATLTPDQVSQLSKESLEYVENLALMMLKKEGVTPTRGGESAPVQTDTTETPRSKSFRVPVAAIPQFMKKEKSERSADKGPSRRRRDG
jgi:hypothetical protein